jgi:hypothetical protein
VQEALLAITKAA